MNEEIFKLADSSIMQYWLVDRIASGYTFDLIKSLYEVNFEKELSHEDFNKFCLEHDEQIRTRHNELKKIIYESGTYIKLNTIADKLYNIVNGESDLSPREVGTLADTLRKYLETLTNFSKTQQVKKEVAKNNYSLLESLESEGLIRINNPSRLKYIVDGVIEAEVND
jgi:uncharacterized protein YfkK (UPF0435 family)